MPAPVADKLNYYLSRTIEDKDGCLIWQGAIQSNGYGSVRINNKKVYVHVFVAIETHPEQLKEVEDKDSVVVMHKCDKRACIKPSCLVIATQGDNIRDAIAKGRHIAPEPRRSLTQDDVDAIRQAAAQGYSMRQIGAVYGINNGNVSRIVRGLSYAN